MACLLKKIARHYGLKYKGNFFYPELGRRASGYVGRYPASMVYFPEFYKRTLTVDFWMTCENAEEGHALTRFLDNLAATCDDMITVAVWNGGDEPNSFGAISLTFRIPKGQDENTEQFLTDTFRRLQVFLEAHHFTAKCGLCGGSDNVGVYLVDNTYSVSHCRECNKNWHREAKAAEKESMRATHLSPAEWGKGILGSLLGVLFGAILWVAVRRFELLIPWIGFKGHILVTVVCGWVIALGCVRGFEIFVKKRNPMSICFQVFIFIFACIFAELCCLALNARETWSVEYPAITVLDVFPAIPDLLYDLPEVRNQVLVNLFLGMCVGGFVFFDIFRKTSCEELVSPEGKKDGR